ncbi:polymeric immunoglobulin receptor-like [Danio aesculapii]|uniref:polymeric immunoglobulin receptor-like n=1 Tax=Danio aesculapii TaxID=1142201 RepID=UPI0024BFF7FE|nr:polymeric immunoglobulin receptor-like [Danio aesculapii]
MIHTLILTGVFLHIGDEAWVNNLNIGVKSGSPGIIPCQYEEQYKENHKYWCWGSVWSACSILANGNETRNKFSITDYSAQSIFTVEWQNLQPSDSGYYWCAVEPSGSGIDAGYYLYLSVQSAPDVSVMNSRVSRHEGGNVSVQCFYSSIYKAKNKRWCRYKDESCFTKEDTDTSQSSSVQISDDGESSFTVLMTGLRLSDSGWYFCSVGDLQVPVQLTVSKPEPKDLYTTQSSAKPIPTTIFSTVSRPEANILNKEHFCLSEN